MTQTMRRVIERLSRLPEAEQERVAVRILEQLEAEEEPQEEDAPFVSAYDRIKHLVGSLEGPGDMSTNSDYLDDLGASSMQ